MSRKRMKWGVISTASFGHQAVEPPIHASNNGEVFAVASRDLKKGTENAADLDIPWIMTATRTCLKMCISKRNGYNVSKCECCIGQISISAIFGLIRMPCFHRFRDVVKN